MVLVFLLIVLLRDAVVCTWYMCVHACACACTCATQSLHTYIRICTEVGLYSTPFLITCVTSVLSTLFHLWESSLTEWCIFQNLFTFNQRTVALQYCVGFCRNQHESAIRYTRPLPLELSSSLPPHHASRLSRRTRLSSLHHTATSH